MLHLKGFFSTWTDSWCILKLDVCANLASQSLHSKGFWTDFLCSFIWCFCEKLALQRLHWNGFFPLWTDIMCQFNVSLLHGSINSVLSGFVLQLNWHHTCHTGKAGKACITYAAFEDFFPSWTQYVCSNTLLRTVVLVENEATVTNGKIWLLFCRIYFTFEWRP